ncbi:MAG: SusD/RagB family nutrient-binding outer membrane lipoprotein [Prolixibacteraceae bacterium]|nr:SusD/RagB family nutrient-binding outer membrane lipoprotein [Prolixibacteraceae bacterium]
MEKFKYIIFLLILSVTFSTSCSDDVLDEIDRDPNNPTEVSVDFILPGVQVNCIHSFLMGAGARYISSYVEHHCNVHLNPYWPERGTDQFNQAYSILKDVNIIIEKGSEENKWTHVGIAQVIKAITLGTLTDIFGDVPYSEALLGSENRNPEYDSQEAIYSELFLILDDAIKNLSKETVVNPGKYDMLLQGDKNMWVKVAWGLKARFYNRLSNIDSSGSATNALLAVKNSFSSAEECLSFSDYENGGSDHINLFSYQEQLEKCFATSVTMLNVLNSFNDLGFVDPRADRWFAKLNGEFVGAPNGENIPDVAHNKYSPISIVNVLSPDAPVMVLTYDELKFIEAEANLRLAKRPEANAAYRKAVEAACSRAGLTTGEIASYTSQGTVFTDNESLNLEMIIKQKYLSFFISQPIEAWSDWRRTGIPSLYNTVEGIPLRLPYPNTELARNSNAPTDINNVTIYTKKVWWAK